MTESEEYLYLIRASRLEMLTEGPTNRESEILTQHFNHLQDLAQRGVDAFSGRTQTSDESTFGIVVFRASSEAEAIETMNTDPAVREGLMTSELFPFRIAVRSSG